MDSLLLEVRQRLRVMARQPGFVAAAVLSLALGLGVNTAVFSAMDALLLRPPAVRDLDRSVYVFHATPETSDRGMSFSAFQAARARTDLFAETMAFTGARPLLFGDGDRRETVYAEPVTASFFSMTDVRLQLGRPFDRDADETIDPPLTVVLGHRFWQRRFASNPALVGSPIVLNGRAFTVSGISAPGFTGLDPEVSVDLWIPITTWAQLVGEPSRLAGDEHWMTTVAKLNDGVSLDQAAAALAASDRSGHRSSSQQTRMRSIRDRASASEGETLAIGATAFGLGLVVLALACMNVANLLLARAAARQREMSLRAALGASRVRLMRLWLIETALLSSAAAVGGMFLASWLLDLVVAFKPPTFMGQASAPTLPLDFRLDGRVFAFELALSMLTSLAVGLLASTGRRFAPGFNLRSAVLASQMALSLTLLIPCGLLVRSALRASAMTPGFSTANVVLLPISSDQSGVRVVKPPLFEPQLIARVASLPGVESVTAMDPVPLWFGGNFASFSVDDARDAYRIGHSRISPRYFATLQIPLIQGRDFTTRDDRSAPRVAIVNETMARAFWPGGAVVGHRLRSHDAVLEIVGVAKDVKNLSLAETSQPWLYRPLAQEPTDNPSLSLAVRVQRDSVDVRQRIEREVRALAPSWPAFAFRTLDEGLALQRQVPRLGAVLFGVLGAFGLLLGAVGIYGVTAYVVKQRTREISIRLALGSPMRRVMALVIKQGLSVCLAGAAIGLVLALVGARFLSSVLVETGAADPLTFVVVPGLLASVALVACYLPARRVTSASVLGALREE
jgi:predicted permease